MRWIKELLKPSLKCERVGHDYADRHRESYRYPSIRGGVADRVIDKEVYCPRCGEVFTPYAEWKRTTLDGLTMDKPDWDKLRADGVLVL